MDRILVSSHVEFQACNGFIEGFAGTFVSSRHASNDVVGNIVVDTVLRHVQGLWGVGAVRGSIGITTVSNMHHSSSPSPSPNNERPTRTIPKKPETYPVTEFCWVAVEDMIIEGAGRRSRDRAHDIEYVGWLWQ